MGQLLVDRFVMVSLLVHRLAARARSFSGFNWSRFGTQIMPLILPEEALGKV
jgi:hypothetical protein